VLQAKADWDENDRRDDMLLPPGLQLERARSLLADPGDTNTDEFKEFISLSSAREETDRKKAADAHQRQVRNRNFVIVGVGCTPSFPRRRARLERPAAELARRTRA
jgi:hypothetical protein